MFMAGIEKNMFADTADLEHLIRIGNDIGCFINEATYAEFEAQFNCAVPIGSRWNCDEYNYTVFNVIDENKHIYKSIRGIMKKVCMWLLVIVGAIIDQLLLYASQTAGITLPFTFLVACIVAIWIICNEIISILENIKDMGVTIPAFLIPLVTHVKSQVEDKVNIDTEKEDSEGE